MTIVVTGAAGFIGYHLSEALLARGQKVIGIDNVNDYYDVRLKQDRLRRLNQHKNFSFFQVNIADRSAMEDFTAIHGSKIIKVIHLAAQAGVRYSLVNPYAYLDSNLTGHLVVLEMCRNLPKLEHLVYASSSSVYGGNTKLPFCVGDSTDTPVSLYAATKKADELLSYSYSHLYGISATGLRFFTVYGPWGRPDMAYFIFTKAIIEDQPISVFNNGNMRRDFTYIDDVINGILACSNRPPEGHKLYNIGNNKPVPIVEMITILEEVIGKKAVLQMKPIESGDVTETFADISESQKDFGYNPKTSITEGLPKFVDWYQNYRN